MLFYVNLIPYQGQFRESITQWIYQQSDDIFKRLYRMERPLFYQLVNKLNEGYPINEAMAKLSSSSSISYKATKLELQ